MEQFVITTRLDRDFQMLRERAALVSVSVVAREHEIAGRYFRIRQTVFQNASLCVSGFSADTLEKQFSRTGKNNGVRERKGEDEGRR